MERDSPLFIALALSPAAIDATVAAVASLRPRLSGYRWLDAPTYHITLHFLGGSSPAQIPALCESLEQVAAQFPPLMVQLAGWGAFPHRQAPRVIWLGVTGESIAIMDQLARALRQALPRRESASFHPHITVARSRKDLRAAPLPEDGLPLPEPITWQVNAVGLYASQRLAAGAVYSLRYAAPLLAALPEPASAPSLPTCI